MVAMSNGEKVIVGISTPREYIENKIRCEWYDSGISFFDKSIKLISSKGKLDEFIRGKLVPKFSIYQVNDYDGFVESVDHTGYMYYYIGSDTVTIDIVGTESFVSNTTALLQENFSIVQSYIKWTHDTNGNYINIPLTTDRLPVCEMYPFLDGESLVNFYDRFMQSTSNILLLIGPPGTGKTTFIRGLLSHAKTSAMVTYDASILGKDSVFADFLEDSECSVMVLEDSDAFLANRTSGNDLMHKFLNVGDGLVSMTGKKLIFSTNLPSVRDVDPALIRPGRCFGVLKFDYLDRQQAKTLADKMGVTLNHDKDKYIVADIFHAKNCEPVQKFGFNQ